MTYDTDEPDVNPHIAFLDSDNPRDREAARFVLELELHNAKERALKNPISDRCSDTRELVDDLRQSLSYTPENSEIKRLEQQAEILDIAFRRLMSDADVTYANSDRLDCDPMKYAAAFKAQDQYRRTVKTVKALKSQAKTKKTRGKRMSKTT